MIINDINSIDQMFSGSIDLEDRHKIMESLATHDFTGMKRTFFISKIDADNTITRMFHESCYDVLGYTKEELETRGNSYFNEEVIDRIVSKDEKERFTSTLSKLVSGELDSSSMYFNVYRDNDLKGYYFDTYFLGSTNHSRMMITYITDISAISTNKFVLGEYIEKLDICILKITYNKETGEFNNYANNVFYKMFDIERKHKNPLEVIQEILQSTHPLDAEVFSNGMKGLIKGESDYLETELRWEMNGIEKWFSIKIIATARIEEKLSLIASIYEITALKRLKESLKVKNHQLEEAFQLTKSQMQVYSKTEPLVSFQSKFFIDKFRIKEEDYTHLGGDVYRVDWSTCVHKYISMSDGKIKNVCDKIEKVLKGELETFEIFDKFNYYGASDEREYYYRLAGSLQPDGQLLMVLTDVTKNFELDKELNRIKKMFNNTLESANVGSFYIDKINNPGKIYAEDVTANLLGISLESDNMYDFNKWFEGLMKSNIKGEDVKQRYQKVIAGEIDDCEFTFERMVNGKKRYIRSIITNIQRDANNNPLFIPGVFVDVTKLVESERKVFEQQIVDIVTGGYNRNKFISDLEDGRFDDRFVAIGNINKFQHVNDFYGHEVGDWFLRELSKVLEFDGRFVIYRIGADIFALTANVATSYKEFKTIAKKLDKGIFSKEFGVNFPIDITFACFENLDLFSSSEASVYSEKAIDIARENNKKTIFVTEDFMGSITNDLIVNYKLVNAVKDKDLFPYYQPIHDVKTGKVYAVEILARWKNDGEVVSAFRFIDIINKLKVIDLLDMQMLEKAHEFYDDLIKHDERNKKIAFTFNASKLSLVKFSERKEEWERLITNNSIPKDKLILELTEEIKIDDEIKESINWMNEHNLYVAVDDYGSGESNISSLADPIIDFVKLDMSVLPKDRFDEKKNLILESFVSMFHRLGKVVCIEGVESEEQLEIVKSYNIELAQGYYFSKPLSGKDLIKYLDSFEEL